MATPVRLRALQHAQTWIGTSEHPPGSNHGPQVNKWQEEAAGTTGFPWCAAFLYCMFLDAGRKLTIRYPASVLSWVEAADGKTIRRVDRPFRGDAVAYSWHGHDPHPGDHIGIVEKVLALPWPRNNRRFYIRTVEGNIGDAVRRKWRWVDPASVAFLRIEG